MEAGITEMSLVVTGLQTGRATSLPALTRQTGYRQRWFMAWLTAGFQQSYMRGANRVSFGVRLRTRHAEAGRASLC